MNDDQIELGWMDEWDGGTEVCWDHLLTGSEIDIEATRRTPEKVPLNVGRCACVTVGGQGTPEPLGVSSLLKERNYWSE